MAGRARKVAKRTESLVVRLTRQEVEKVQKIAAGSGKTVSEWIRERIHLAPVEKKLGGYSTYVPTNEAPRVFMVKHNVRDEQEPEILVYRRATLTEKEVMAKRREKKSRESSIEASLTPGNRRIVMPQADVVLEIKKPKGRSGKEN